MRREVRDTQELAEMFPDASLARLEAVRTYLADLQDDLNLIHRSKLSFLEPLTLPAHADRWIENGGGDDDGR